jgi:hypothetical protein
MKFNNIDFFSISISSKNVFSYYNRFVKNAFRNIEKFKNKYFEKDSVKHNIPLSKIFELYKNGFNEGINQAEITLKKKGEISQDAGKFYLFEIASTYNIHAKYCNESLRYYFKDYTDTKHDPEIIKRIGRIIGEYQFSWQKVLENHRVFEPLFKKEVYKIKNDIFNKPLFPCHNVKVIGLPDTMQIAKDFGASIIKLNSILNKRKKELLEGRMNEPTMNHIFRFDILGIFENQCLEFLQETTNNLNNGIYKKYLSNYNCLLSDLNTCISTLDGIKSVFTINMSFVPEYYRYGENWLKVIYDKLVETKNFYLKITKADKQTCITGFQSNLEPKHKETLKNWIYHDSLKTFINIENELLERGYLNDNYKWVKYKTFLIDFLITIQHNKFFKNIVKGQKKQDFHYRQFISELYGYGKTGLTETSKKHKPKLEIASSLFLWVENHLNN